MGEIFFILILAVAAVIVVGLGLITLGPIGWLLLFLIFIACLLNPPADSTGQR